MQHVNSVLTQNAYVVRDIEASMHQWINTMGIGPFFLLDHIQLTDVIYRGALRLEWRLHTVRSD